MSATDCMNRTRVSRDFFDLWEFFAWNRTNDILTGNKRHIFGSNTAVRFDYLDYIVIFG